MDIPRPIGEDHRGPSHAWVDESEPDNRVDPGTYILAATICAPGDAGELRDQITPQLLQGQRKLRWRDESTKRRRQITEALAMLNLATHVVVVRTSSVPERSERRRRLCLERLLFELDVRQVTLVTAESRGQADDKRDRHMLDALRARKVLGPSIRLSHCAGPKEPLLWLPDLICGAVSDDRCGNPEYLDAIVEHIGVTVVTIESGS